MGCCSSQVKSQTEEKLKQKKEDGGQKKVAINIQSNLDKDENKSDSDSKSDEYIDDNLLHKKKNKDQPRGSVSAEVFGLHNKKSDFKPTVIQKSAIQKSRILSRLNQAFMFSALDDKEKDIVVDAMEEKRYQPGDYVIKQGQDGDLLYVVEKGSLKCFKKFSGQDTDTYLKTYQPGESFGELALLYNAPRAATIQAETESILFALDRQTFNHIVKDAASKKREKYENFLLNVELLESMDPYERIKIADAVTEISYKQGDFIMRQGEIGDCFYFLEEGECVALKIMEEGEEAQEVYEYKKGDYFGELALIKKVPRQASIRCETDVKVVKLDVDSFQRLLGPVEDILKRNMEKYEKFSQKQK